MLFFSVYILKLYVEYIVWLSAKQATILHPTSGADILHTFYLRRIFFEVLQCVFHYNITTHDYELHQMTNTKCVVTCLREWEREKAEKAYSSKLF